LFVYLGSGATILELLCAASPPAVRAKEREREEEREREKERELTMGACTSLGSLVIQVDEKDVLEWDSRSIANFLKPILQVPKIQWLENAIAESGVSGEAFLVMVGRDAARAADFWKDYLPNDGPQLSESYAETIHAFGRRRVFRGAQW
jgi:hypothetical protein